jgi:LPS-assembly lipoprotein
MTGSKAMSRILAVVLAVLVVLATPGCGFELRREAELTPAWQRLAFVTPDDRGLLAREVRAALARGGATVVPATDGVPVVRVLAAGVSVEPVAIDATARVQEYAVILRVELEAQAADGSVALPRQAIELRREYAFDESQALGAQAQQDLIRRELEREMVQQVMLRIAALR